MLRNNLHQGQSWDKALYIILKITLVGAFLLAALSYFTSLEKIWFLSFLTLGISLSALMMILKGAQTGKRYAEGVKHRKEKYLPILDSNSDSLKDDVDQVINMNPGKNEQL